MARVKLTLPDKMAFVASLEVRITDLNYGGHLGNDRILAYAQEARCSLLSGWGATEIDAFGKGMIIADAAIQFKSEGFFPEKIEMYMGVSDISPVGWDFYYNMVIASRNKTLAIVKTGMVAFDYQSGKMVDIPMQLASHLRAMAGLNAPLQP